MLVAIFAVLAFVAPVFQWADRNGPLDWTRLTIAVTFSGISLLQTSSAVELARAIVVLGALALVCGITFFLVRMVRINTRLQQQTGNDYAQRSVDESHWRHGGLTYSNPEDPALVVEKLVGVGSANL